jgi:molecular chaperone DnaK
MDKDDLDAIRKGTEDLSQIIQQVGASMYQETQAAGETKESPPPDSEGQTPPSGDEDVVDGEFKNI